MKPNRYVICASCNAMNPSFEATCDQCGAPISDIPADESSRPAESVVRRTRFRPPSSILLIGLWMLSLPNVLGGGYFAFLVLKHMGRLAGFIMFWGDVGLTFLWFIILYRITRNYFFRDPAAGTNR